MNNSTNATAFSTTQNITRPSLIGMFFPWLGIDSIAAQQLPTNNFGFYACATIVFLSRYAYYALEEWVKAYFVSTIHIFSNDEVYHVVMSWLSRQPSAATARSSLASVGGRRMRLYSDTTSDHMTKKALIYLPWNTSFVFRHDGRFFVFCSSQKETNHRTLEQISVSCIGGLQPIKTLFEHCRTDYVQRIRNKTSIFERQDDDWIMMQEKDIRPMNTVILDAEVKKDLVNDIADFLDPQTQRWYSGHGIPYRRGLLFWGPPGTGKSSVAFALAGCFDLDIFVLSLAGLDDQSLALLFTELPPRCIVLVEDIDVAHSTQRRDIRKHSQGTTNEKEIASLSLSGILNAIDGVAAHEGRVLIMTTNNKDQLDPALVRAGRVDNDVYFGLANKDMMIKLFHMVFMPNEADIADLEKREAEVKEIEKLAAEFAAKLEVGKYSPAKILSLLSPHRRCPAGVLANVDDWVNKLEKENEWKNS